MEGRTGDEPQEDQRAGKLSGSDKLSRDKLSGSRGADQSEQNTALALPLAHTVRLLLRQVEMRAGSLHPKMAACILKSQLAS